MLKTASRTALMPTWFSRSGEPWTTTAESFCVALFARRKHLFGTGWMGFAAEAASFEQLRVI